MPLPKPPSRFTGKMSPSLAELQQLLNGIAETERTTALVDYLHDLRKEFDWAAAELKQLGFCTPCYLSQLDDGDDHDCVEQD